MELVKSTRAEDQEAKEQKPREIVPSLTKRTKNIRVDRLSVQCVPIDCDDLRIVTDSEFVAAREPLILISSAFISSTHDGSTLVRQEEFFRS